VRIAILAAIRAAIAVSVAIIAIALRAGERKRSACKQQGKTQGDELNKFRHCLSYQMETEFGRHLLTQVSRQNPIMAQTWILSCAAGSQKADALSMRHRPE
jgi:hypothetical protein